MNATPTVKRLFYTLAVTIGMFCVYYFILTPNIEPQIPKSSTDTGDGSDVKKPGALPPSVKNIFSPNAWELSTGAENLIKSDNILMLFQKFSIDDKMCVKSGKCTILIAPEEKIFPMEERPGKPFHPVIISILKEAEIQLSIDGDGFTPRPQRGCLNGPVTIDYKMPIRGHFLDCNLTTSDVICDMRSLQTVKPVHFELGPLYGEGKQFNLIFRETKDENNVFSGVRLMRLDHVKHITLKMTPFLLQQVEQKFSDKIRERFDKMFGEKMEFPVTLTCDGPMIYDVETGNVMFSQNVKIACNYTDLPADELRCEELTLQLTSELNNSILAMNETLFSEDSTTSTSSEVQSTETASGNVSVPKESDKKVPLKNIKAHQNVKLSIPTFNVAAEAETLEFHFPDKTLQLSGSQQAAIHFAQHEFHANHISYTFPPKPDQKFGAIHVDGNGWFRTYITDSKDQERLTPLTFHWRQEFSTQICENNRYLINVQGNVEVQTPQIGTLIANRIQCQLRLKTEAEVQQERAIVFQLNRANPHQSIKNPEITLFPDWIAATGNVQLQVEQETARLRASLQEIHFQFEAPKRIPSGLISSYSQNPNASNNGNLRPFPPLSSTKQNPEQRHFILKDAALHGKIQLLPGRIPFYITEMSLLGANEQNFILYEEQFLKNSEQRISLQARKVVLYDVLPETLQCEIIGAPALLAGFGIRLESPKITLNCAANRIDVCNAGKMQILYRIKTTQSMNHSELMESLIEWDKNLSFDGQLISAQDNVRVKTSSTTLRADAIKAVLAEKIQLNNPPKVERKTQKELLDFFAAISAERNVVLQHRNYEQNQLVDVCTVKTHFANFQPGTMDLNVSGKGSLRLSHFVSEEEKKSSENTVPKISSNWFQIFMEYVGGISGNLANGEFTVKDRISAIAHPVPDPGFNIRNSRIDQRQIPEDGFQFTCDQIYISQTPTIHPETFQMMNMDSQSIELKAEGNIHMENNIYSVDGNTLKYSQEKNACFIYGTPRRPIYATKQEFEGGRRSEMTAGSIEINLKNMRCNLDDVMLDGSF